MSDGMITALSGAIARQQRLDDVSHNLANAETVGYRQRRVSFESILVDKEHGVYNTRRAGESIDLSDGALQKTDNPLDVAISGRGFFRVGDAKGGVKLTRNGQFRLDAQGNLRTKSGLSVLDDKGAPIQLQATPSELMINETGDVWDAYGMVASLGIVDVQNPKGLKASGQGLYTTHAKNLMPATGELVQGSLEKGNVNTVRTMTDMIMLHRHFDAMNNLIQVHKRIDDKALSVGVTR